MNFLPARTHNWVDMKINEIETTEDALASFLALAATATLPEEALMYLMDAEECAASLDELAVARAKIRALEIALGWWELDSSFTPTPGRRGRATHHTFR